MRTAAPTPTFGLISLLQVLMMVATVTLIALGYVVQNTTNKDISEQIRIKEKQLAQLKQEAQSLTANVALLKNSDTLRKRIAELQLPLQEIREEQILRQDALALPNLAPNKAEPIRGVASVGAKVIGTEARR